MTIFLVFFFFLTKYRLMNFLIGFDFFFIVLEHRAFYQLSKYVSDHLYREDTDSRMLD